MMVDRAGNASPLVASPQHVVCAVVDGGCEEGPIAAKWLSFETKLSDQHHLVIPLLGRGGNERLVLADSCQ